MSFLLKVELVDELDTAKSYPPTPIRKYYCPLPKEITKEEAIRTTEFFHDQLNYHVKLLSVLFEVNRKQV